MDIDGHASDINGHGIPIDGRRSDIAGHGRTFMDSRNYIRTSPDMAWTSMDSRLGALESNIPFSYCSPPHTMGTQIFCVLFFGFFFFFENPIPHRHASLAIPNALFQFK